jgi:transketolase
MDTKKLDLLARAISKDILSMSTIAGSGHPTSSLSATDLMTVLFEEFFTFDPANPDNPANDRLIFSKGHASPLFYSLYRRAGVITAQELEKYRTFDSPLEGHPTRRFPFTRAATGSLGQGLAVAVGEALAGAPRVFVLLGDGELAEGSIWEAAAAASFYKRKNLIAIADINALGQSQETMYGHDTDVYKKRFEAFGWEANVINGHNVEEIYEAFCATHDRPYIIIAKTIKGKGVLLLEGKDGWHGKPLPKEDLEQALLQLGEIDDTVMFTSRLPESKTGQIPATGYRLPASGSQIPASGSQIPASGFEDSAVVYDKPVATRRAFGDALLVLARKYPDLIVIDGDTKNSTYTELVAKEFPDKFLELYIAEQTMAGVALGLGRSGKRPVVSTFAAFLTRAFDQIRMASVSEGNILFNGSHAGVSIGQDGASQMGLEDLAMFRAILGSTVVYPSDPYQTHALMKELITMQGIRYIRTTRGETPVIYKADDVFPIGGSKTFESSVLPPTVTVVAAGITLHEALKAQKILENEHIGVRVIDCYSIKPIDKEAIEKAAKETQGIIVVEDHYPQGGIGEALPLKPLIHLAVRKTPRSGTPQQLLAYEEIDTHAIVRAVKSIIPAQGGNLSRNW